ncbi:MAG TPA: IS1634 family transposase [Coleofasciculaceae cyanobacterium]
MSSVPEIAVQNLDHLGLVAGLIDEIGIVEQINQLVGEKSGEIVSPGHAVKAMILNGLGLVSAPLYLFSQFFEGKATEHLIGEGIQPKHLNDDRLGRVLDKLYVTGTSQIFTLVALAAAQKFEVSLNTVHLDSSSFHLHGEYESNLPEVYFSPKEVNLDQLDEQVSNSKTAPVPIRITYGYSRDHRPDLKQFILDLICSGDGDVPLFLRVASGNESDSAVFAQIFREFKKQLELDALMVADSALYTAPNIEQMATLRWLCRVPLTLKSARQLIEQLSSKDFVESTIPGYRWAAHTSNYGGVNQRWLIVESETRRVSDLRQLEKNIAKAHQEAKKKLRELAAQEFACEPDARAAANRLSKQLKYHNLTQIQPVPVVSEFEPNSCFRAESYQQAYKIQAQLEPDTDAIARQTLAAGRFILATNVLDIDQLSCDEMIAKYKEQQSSERGFAFLKNPLFFTDSVFLKSPERIEALALVMGLCLLVYTLGQRYLRSRLQQSHSTLKNQLGQPTLKPTLRWIFQCFQSVHFLRIATVKQISNLTQERLDILRFFPASCRAYYLLLST